MRISDWSSDVCSSDLVHVCVPLAVAVSSTMVMLFAGHPTAPADRFREMRAFVQPAAKRKVAKANSATIAIRFIPRSEEHTSELQSLMRISYAVFCLKKKIYTTHNV